MLSGLAPDGGLYVPEAWPRLADATLMELRGRPYADVAAAVVGAFAGTDIPAEVLRGAVEGACAAFSHPAVAPLKQVDANQFILELFHGPTLAFKDVALQLLARLMDWSLERRGETATILCATSGDTGGAAIEAFRAATRARIVVLHPRGRVSDVQRRQMTTVDAPNVRNVSIEGTFDDCQAIVKALFADEAFRRRMRLGAVNSINFARIVAQAAYYVSSSLALGGPYRDVSFTVPTGNFGNIFAGDVARRLGAPIRRLVLATNVNDILDRALRSGRYEVAEVAATASPSMDIQVSSNFERLLFEATGRDADAVRRSMAGLRQSGGFTIADRALAAMRRVYLSGRTDEASTLRTMAETLARTGELIDPHTAVGYAVARSHDDGETPMITLATAHPAKFPDAVEKAIGRSPPVPQRLSGLDGRREIVVELQNDVASVKNFVESGN